MMRDCWYSLLYSNNSTLDSDTLTRNSYLLRYEMVIKKTGKPLNDLWSKEKIDWQIPECITIEMAKSNCQNCIAATTIQLGEE